MRARDFYTVETARAGVFVKLMEDDHPISHYRRTSRMSDRQCDALERLARTFNEAGLFPKVVGGDGMRAGGYGELSDEAAEAWKEYCEMIGKAPLACQPALAAVARGTFPTMPNHMYLLQTGATAVADFLEFQY